MSEPNDPPVTEEARTARRANDQALAVSSPDESWLIMRMLAMLHRFKHPFAQPFVLTFSFVITVLFIMVTKGVTAILALQPLIMQRWETDNEVVIADREVQASQAKATQDVLTALQGIGSKLDTQGVKIDVQGRKLDAQGQQIEELSRDVGTLKQAQANTDRRVGSIASSQAQLRDRLNKAP